MLENKVIAVKKADEVAAFLLSDPARFMMGDTVNASCGLAVA